MPNQEAGNVKYTILSITMLFIKIPFLFRNAISKRKIVTLLQQTANNRWGIEFATFVSLFNHELYALD